jgi:hypothetical protein
VASMGAIDGVGGGEDDDGGDDLLGGVRTVE